MVAMAGIHQIWLLDLTAKTMGRVSGSGAEGNLNTNALESTWAQPSGISFGKYNDRDCYFVADSESSAVRVMYADDYSSESLAGGAPDDKDLCAFGDKPGKGCDAKLQHLIGVHYHDGQIFVADTYNHKVKVMKA